MRTIRTLLLAGLAALTITTAASAQGIPLNTVKNFIDWWNMMFGWHESIATMTCMNNKIFWVTYVVYNDGTQTDIPVRITPTGDPCECKAGGSARPAMFATTLEPHDSEDCHHSRNNLSSQSTGVTGTGGSGSRASSLSVSTGFLPPVRPHGSPARSPGALVSFAKSPRAAPPGSTAFEYTLPFRALPNGVVLSAKIPQVPWQCNTSIHPSMYSVDHTGDTVSRIDLCTGNALATINVASLPLQVKVTPDGAQAIVTSYQNAVTFIDTNTNQVTDVIQLDPSFTPSGLAISPDGTYALITNYEAPPDSFIAMIDLTTKKVTSNIALSTEYPQSIFLNPDASLVWVVYPFDNVVDVVDLLTGVTIQHLAVPEPMYVAFNPTGTVAYVASGAGEVLVLDTSTYARITTISTDPGTTDLKVSPDEAFVVGTNGAAQSMILINTQTLKGMTSPVMNTPYGAVLAPTQ